MVKEENIKDLGWDRKKEIEEIMEIEIRVKELMKGILIGIGIKIVDLKMECGRMWEGEMMRIVVEDEIQKD